MSDLRPIITEYIRLGNAKELTDDVIVRKLIRATDSVLRVVFLRDNQPVDITGSTVVFRVQNSDKSWVREFSSTLTDAENGQADIAITASGLDNSGEFDGQIVMTDSDGYISCWQLVDLTVDDLITNGVTPPAGNPIDWSTYTGYSNTATDGPYTAGTGIAFGTADGDGKVPINATATSAEWGNITGTLSAQTDLQAELDGKLDADGTAADVNPAGTAIAAALDNKLDLTGETDQTVEGVIRTSGGSALGATVRGATAITLGPVGGDIGKLRIGSTNETVLESLVPGVDLILRARQGGETTGDIRVGDLGETLYTSAIKAADATLPIKDSTGTTQATIDSNGLTATTSVVPASDNTAVLGTPSLQWLAGYISVLNAGVVHAVGASGIGFKDSTGTVQATIDSNGLTVTNKQASAYVNTDKRVATMTGDETLTATSAMLQFLDPADADRNVDLPNGTQFTVKNTGDGGETLTVRDASDVTIDTVENGVTLTFIDATGSGGWEVLT